MMRPEDYPEQEPFSTIGALYHEEVYRLAQGVDSVEISVGDDPYQGLSIYPAATPTGDVLCVMHGGGWTNGYKEWMAFMAPALTARGITLVSIGYRLAPKHVHPAQFEDCAAAVAWVFGHIADHGGDPDRIFVSGHSAGGHLASLLALRTDWRDEHELPPDVIKGALPISGTFLFGEESGLSMRPRFLGDPALAMEGDASPVTHLHGRAPPFLIAHGDKDFPHLRAQGEDFARRLTDLGVPAEIVVLPDSDHLGASYESGRADGTWIGPVLRFMATGRSVE